MPHKSDDDFTIMLSWLRTKTNKIFLQLTNNLKKTKIFQVLTVDWSRHDQNLIATGGSDGLIKGWDLRNFRDPLFELYGCSYAVRRLQFSPFAASTLASVSYDFTTRIWDFNQGPEAQETITQHSEFNYGLDWNQLRTNQLADCGWDSLVHVFTPRTLA